VSADNWTQCPCCRQAWTDELQRRGVEVEAAYGKVTPDEYERLREGLRKFAGARRDETFREDYEIGIDGDFFVVDYCGRCDKCGFGHTFKRRDVLHCEVGNGGR
jgi:hypothetical protein